MSGIPHAQHVTATGRGPSIVMTAFDLGPLGYRLDEWFVEGEARGYEPVGELGEDGRWDVRPGPAAGYRTRIVVVRPHDPARFDGTVVVEWFNVSAGFDSAPDWVFVHNQVMRRGSAYVGVSAQAVGVQGGTTITGERAPGGLVAADPERYGSLVHPGDAFSFDILSDVGRLLRSGAGPLGELRPRTVVAIGESQSAFYLVTYLNAVAPVDEVFDGFVVHGRGAGSAPLSRPPHADAPAPARVRVRTDLGVPAIVVQSETDVVVLGSLRSRQPDAERLRVWEIAGAAHADTYTLAGMSDTGSLTAQELAVALAPTALAAGMATASPINSGPQQHYVVQAALEHVVGWAEGRAPAPAAAPLEVEQTDDGPRFATDVHGNALGGVRTPWVDVPTAVLTGLGQTGLGFARLFGRTEPFDDATLDRLYPTRDAYLDAFTAATDATIAAGFLLGDDRDEILSLAAASWDLRTGPGGASRR